MSLMPSQRALPARAYQIEAIPKRHFIIFSAGALEGWSRFAQPNGGASVPHGGKSRKNGTLQKKLAETAGGLAHVLAWHENAHNTVAPQIDPQGERLCKQHDRTKRTNQGL
jgi:hypothetical protein